VKKDSSQALEQNDWQEFKPLFGGGKIKICDTLRAVTPFGGLSVLIEFFGRIGLVEQLENRQFYQPKSPNHYDPGQILIGFVLSVIAGAQRFAHTNQLRADRALQALLGMERFPSDDTILNYFRRFSRPRSNASGGPCGAGSSVGFQSWKRVLVWIWIRRFFLGMVLSNKEPPGATILVDRADSVIIRSWRSWQKSTLSYTVGCAVEMPGPVKGRRNS